MKRLSNCIKLMFCFLIMLAINKICFASGSINITLIDTTYSSFPTTTIAVQIDDDNMITLPSKFSEMVSVNVPVANRVDEETFYFNNNWQTDTTAYAYSFTGWKVSGTTGTIPMQNVFQPGDYFPADRLDSENCILEALWGKTIFIRNAYNTMHYNVHAILDETASEASGLTGASDSNTGRTVSDPVATINYAYTLFPVDKTTYNPYVNVIMLVGNLDYVKSNGNHSTAPGYNTSYQNGRWGNVSSISNAKNITFKSRLDTDKNYTLRVKAYNYTNTYYGSLRFDNVDLTVIKSAEFDEYDSSKMYISSHISPSAYNPGASAQNKLAWDNSVTEYTNRCTNTGSSNHNVAMALNKNFVFNGCKFGTIYYSNETSYNYPTATDIHYTLGKNVTVTNFYMGTSYTTEGLANYSYGDTTLDIFGGKVTTGVYSANSAMLSNTYANRTINIVKGNIKTLYGGSTAGTIWGDVIINVRNSDITNLYGGGNYFSAYTYGDVTLNISNSRITKLNGGGYNGNVLPAPADATYVTPGHGGKVTMNITDGSVINGDLFGSGMGGSQTLSASKLSSVSVTNFTNGNAPEWWYAPFTDYPAVDEETGYIITEKYHSLTGTANSHTTSVYCYRYTVRAYLSLAMVGNVEINIADSTIKGNVYGGGSIAVVNGNTDIKITNGSVITGYVFGGGDGVTVPGKVTVYKPLDPATYVPLAGTLKADGSYTGNSTEKAKVEASKYGSFTWTTDTAVRDMGWIDYDNLLLYSPNAEGLGMVKGNTSVLIDNSEVKKAVFAGGNAGIVEGSTTLNLQNNPIIGSGTVATADRNTYKVTEFASFAGGNSAPIKGSTTTIITDVNLSKVVYGGGNQGNVNGNCNVTINTGTVDTVFGGGNLGVVEGNTNVVVGNSTNPYVTVSSLLYGGGKGTGADFETVHGNATVLIEGLNTRVENYGSSSLGKVVGDVDLTFKDYWTGNTTNKYKTMNGIDRATNVYFNNAYVLLENKAPNGDLEGIKDITNIYIPNGSGLKVSATGEILGDFHGGGDFFLDSEVCITVDGDIYGDTLLVLNPLIAEDIKMIKGSADYPYMIVKGVDHSTGAIRALYSNDARYEIIHGTNSSRIRNVLYSQRCYHK